MPKPPAAFSPLTTTKSSARSRRSRGNISITTARPARPTRSPQNRILMGRASGPLGRPAHGVLCRQPVELLVVILTRHRLDLLPRIGEADRRHRAQGAQLGQRAIVEAAAIAQPI